jgi:hypothetical protein
MVYGIEKKTGASMTMVNLRNPLQTRQITVGADVFPAVRLQRKIVTFATLFREKTLFNTKV